MKEPHPPSLVFFFSLPFPPYLPLSSLGPPVPAGLSSALSWSLELGAKKFHEQRTAGPLLFESAPTPPSAGFNVTFEDLTLDTAAGAPLIFARLTAV